jgi:Sulfotransferase family
MRLSILVILSVAVLIVLIYMSVLNSMAFQHSSHTISTNYPLPQLSSTNSQWSLNHATNNNKLRPTINQTHRLLFVHVGKTGGQSIKRISHMGCQTFQQVRRRQLCHDKVPPTVLANAIYGYFHCYIFKPRDYEMSGYTGFLVTLRHPLDRARSWYEYVHPDHCNERWGTPSCATRKIIRQNPDSWEFLFFKTCFSTFHHWIQSLTNTSTGSSHISSADIVTLSSPQCRYVARVTAKGHLPSDITTPAHMIANIAYYQKNTLQAYPDKKVYVVRMESLWQDLKRIDQILGGPGDFGELDGTRTTHGSEGYAEMSTNDTDTGVVDYFDQFTRLERMVMCCSMTEDMQSYRDILFRAENIQRTAAEQTWQGVVARCGASSWDDFVRECETVA